MARKSLCSGAAGIVLKVQPPAVLIAVIESLCAPELQVEREKIRPVPSILNAQNNGNTSDPELLRITGLTAREREIICLIGKGLKNRIIADRLCISETTVRHHLTNIFSKRLSFRRFFRLVLQPLLFVPNKSSLCASATHAKEFSPCSLPITYPNSISWF